MFLTLVLFSVDPQTLHQLWGISVRFLKHGAGVTSNGYSSLGSTDTSRAISGHHFTLFSSCFAQVEAAQTQDIEKHPIFHTPCARSGREPLVNFMTDK